MFAKFYFHLFHPIDGFGFNNFFLLLLQEVPDENYDLPYNQTETNGDAVMIKMDVPNRDEPSFPKEKWKSLIGKLANRKRGVAIDNTCHLEKDCF